MKSLLRILSLLLLSALTFGQSVPVCDPNNPPPNCTDYFGVANWVNSPLPAGSITGFTIVASGSGYLSPSIAITDTTGSGVVSSAITITQDASGGIASVTIAPGSGGSGYIAPQVTIVDLGVCGGVGQTACGSGAIVTAAIGGPKITGGIRKFVDTLTLPLAGLSLAVPDTTTFPGSDYYVIAVQQYTSKMHTDLPPTTLRGYVQLNNGTDTAGNNTLAPSPISYLGPTIIAQKNRPVRVLFKNMLPTGSGGNLFIPVDTTYMGAGSPYTQNRAVLHLHGGATPWISDGTPMQWTAPAGESPLRGDSVQFVPDMWFDANGVIIAACAGQPTCNVPNAINDPGQGNLTFFWTNGQGGRLMFYHDHSLGITRLNVYAGEAAGYLLIDPTEEAALAAATVPNDLAHLVPLVIQDKTFVPSAAEVAAEDPTWTAGGFGTVPGGVNTGDLWFPHVYTPNQNPADVGGANPFGRWDYGPWTLPGNQTTLSAADPASAVDVPCLSSAFPNQVVRCPITPNPSGTPEGFMDTPVVNGKAYPVLHVAPEAYRFRILSVGNDRSLNLQFYVADPTIKTPDGRSNTEVTMVPAIQPGAGSALPLCTAITPITNTTLFMGLATALLDGSGNPINGTGLPANCWPTFGSPAQAAGIPVQQTMWAADGRAGGVPDPRTAGPPFIQIGTEGGLLPAPVVIPSMPTGYEANTRSVTITNVSVHGLWLGPAERADTIVDFSKFGGKTLILYNDAPTPAPAVDSRLDYYTGDGDQTSIGGAPNTLPGYGPNTRTIMQIVVDQPPTGKPFSLSSLQAALPSIFKATQPVPIVPEPTYPPASGGYSATPTYSLITDDSVTFYPIGSTTPATYIDERKTIQELFTLDYGRMNATLGVELPLTNFLTQTTIPLGFIDPPTEIIKQGDTQFWHITHNGVDTHFVHFHLFNVQVINRSAWDGTKRPPDENELGWKETVRMNPLEDILVALQPITPIVPFPLRDSYRLMDVTMPVGSDCPVLTANSVPAPCSPFTNIDPATNTGTQTPNAMQNFGWEYVWHCHILGHEENDMMRAIAFNVPPEAPSNLTATAAASGLNLTWTDNSASETGFTIERATTPDFLTKVTDISVPTVGTDANGQGITWGGSITYNDTNATTPPYFYRVKAIKPLASYWSSGTVSSAWSNTASSVGPFAGVSPLALAFGVVPLLTSSAAQTITLSNTGTLPFTYMTVSQGANSADFSVTTDLCGGTVAALSNCAISVKFTPSVSGPESGTLSIATNDPANPTLSVSLTGAGGSQPLLTITASNATMKYGSAVPVINPGYNPANPAGLTAPTCTTTATTTSPVGYYPSSCSGAVGPYTITYVAGTVSVTPVPLTVWGPNVSILAGSTIPATFSPSYVGFVAGDTSASLTTQPTCTTAATSSSPIGTYPITCTGAVDPNYAISYVNGTLTISKGNLVITAPSPTMVYGGPLPTFTPTYSPAVPVPPFTAPVCTTTATASSPVGTYSIYCSGAVDPNYTIAYVSGTLTVTPAALTITAPSPSVTYGAATPALTPTFTGFVAGDTAAKLTTQPTCITTYVPGNVAGSTSPVTCSGAVDPNYAISYVGGTLTVTPATLTITASNGAMTYGGTVPTITPNIAGFVLGQNSSVLTTQPTCSTTATSASQMSPPTYPSTCSGAVAANYTLTYVAGAVTINPAALTITANSAAKNYGATLTFLGTEFTPTGLLNGDKVSSATLTSAGAAATANVGSYPIVPSAAIGTGLANYTINYVNGTLAVNPVALTITANNLTKIYGQTLTFSGKEFTPRGLLNSDTVTSVTLISTGASSSAAVGSYPIAPSAAVGIGLTNYTISYVNGTLTVNKATSTTTIITNLPSPAIVGQIVTVRFGVAPQFTGTPTGTVIVTASTGESCTGGLSAGVGSCTMIFTTGGTRTLTAAYSGDTNFIGNTSAGATQVVSSVSLSTTSLLFGNQLVGTTSARQTVTLSNVGITPLAITGIAVAGSNAADFLQAGNCPVGGTLAVGRSCSINMTFRPSAVGGRTATISVSDLDSTSPQQVSLTGTGVAPIATLSPAGPFAFSSAPNVVSSPQTLTLQNTGTAPLVITGITDSGTNANQFAETTTCATGAANPLAVGATCTISVTFRPTSGTSGTVKTATLNVNVAAPAISQTASLTGTVTAPILTLSTNSLAFGTQARGTSSTQTVVVTNAGTAPLTLNRINLSGTNPGQFGQTNNCGATLAPNGTCAIAVTFSPTTIGAKTASLNVNVAAPATSQSVTLTGTGL